MKHFLEHSPTAARIVDAAEGLLQQRGYNGFSYDDVARIVGIKKPSIHHHFPSKAALVAVVAQRYTHGFRAALQAVDAQHAHAPERLAAYAALFEHTFARDRRLCVCGMLGADADALPAEVLDEVSGFFQLNLDWLGLTFSEGQQQGLITQQTAPAALAEAFLCALEGAMVVGRGLRSARGPGAVAHTVLGACGQAAATAQPPPGR